jgi:hypothetical protein
MREIHASLRYGKPAAGTCERKMENRGQERVKKSVSFVSKKGEKWGQPELSYFSVQSSAHATT